MKILLVDDDAFLRDMYATKFKELKYVIDTAETAEIAVLKLQNETFDVILMDMIMPGMTGTELLKRVKSEKLGGDPICIMLSNQSEGSDKTAALEAGAVGYIVKADYIPSDIVAEVQKIINNTK